jgi:hypothetical protein
VQPCTKGFNVLQVFHILYTVMTGGRRVSYMLDSIGLAGFDTMLAGCRNSGLNSESIAGTVAGGYNTAAAHPQ